MADETRRDLAERIEQLEGRLRVYEQREQLARAVDEALELAGQQHLALGRTLSLVLPLLVDAAEARAVRVRTYGEDLELAEQWQGDAVADDPWVQEQLVRVDRFAGRSEGFSESCSAHAIVGRPLDVAGESFGSVTLVCRGELTEPELDRLSGLLEVFAEQIDGYLAAIAQARLKQRVTLRLSEALRAPMLDSGVDRAIDVLWRQVGFEQLVLVYRHHGAQASAGISYKVFRSGELLCDSSAAIGPNGELSALMREHTQELMHGRPSPLLERLGIGKHREEVLISGTRRRRVVGRLIVARQANDFNTNDRDLLQSFAGYLRQRIVDFNREWKYLSLCFPPAVVAQLMAEEDYTERYLSPRLRDVAVMFCDLSGFTRICEQELRDPARIGELIDRWSAQVVELIWRSGGVLDKMVGDCAIGLWGPPFFQLSAAEATRRAARCALDIRQLTRELPLSGLGIDATSAPSLAVATGLNYCPLFVGLFGPNDDYTGFSSGMNNTARLQALAQADEVLCTADFARAHGAPDAFGAEQAAAVKNVAEPLSYRPLRTD